MNSSMNSHDVYDFLFVTTWNDDAKSIYNALESIDILCLIYYLLAN